MATIAKKNSPMVSTSTPGHEHQLAGLLAFEDLKAGDAVYIKNDGSIAKWVPTQKFRGCVVIDTPAGDSATIWSGVNIAYGSGLTPGAEVYTSTTVAGALDNASVATSLQVGYCVDAERIYIYPLGPVTPA